MYLQVLDLSNDQLAILDSQFRSEGIKLDFENLRKPLPEGIKFSPVSLSDKLSQLTREELEGLNNQIDRLLEERRPNSDFI